MHPMFVTLFIETATDDPLTEEQDRKRRARAVRRGRSARARRVTAAHPDRPRRPRGYAATKATTGGGPVHSFATMLENLATIAANRIQPTDSLPAFTVITTPTPIQR